MSYGIIHILDDVESFSFLFSFEKVDDVILSHLKYTKKKNSQLKEKD